MTNSSEITSRSWLDAVVWNDVGLVPAIAQDAVSGQVLMMAWMNRESLARTIAIGEAVYWSRSRNAIWHKGETSGHILCLDRTTTGDGLISALQVLAIMVGTGKPLAELAAGMRKFPQVMLNVKVKQRYNPMTVDEVASAVSRVNTRLGKTGRVVLRASGTEPVIRVMVESPDMVETRAAAEELAEVVRKAKLP